MKKSIKFLAVMFFALCLSFSTNAQTSDAPSKLDKTVKVKKKNKAAKYEKHAHKLADKAAMTEEQRAQFVPAHIEFKKAAHAIKKTKPAQEVKKAQMKELKTEHKAYLSTFLSDEQMKTMRRSGKKGKGKVKGKRKMKKAKHVKRMDVQQAEPDNR